MEQEKTQEKKPLPLSTPEQIDRFKEYMLWATKPGRDKNRQARIDAYKNAGPRIKGIKCEE